MRYALTFTNPETYDWNETDTIIIESNTNPIDMDIKKLANLISANTRYYGVEKDWIATLGNDSWFVRNCDDVDLDLTVYENGELDG